VSVIISLLSLPGLPFDYKITSPDFIANLCLNETRCKSFLEYDLKHLQITHTALGSGHKLSGQALLSFCKIRILREIFQDDFACIPVFMPDGKIMTLI